MKPLFTKVIAVATTEVQARETIKNVMDNIHYLDKIAFIRDNGFIMISIRIKNKIYKIESHKREWRNILKYLHQHNWIEYIYESSIAFYNPEKYDTK